MHINHVRTLLTPIEALKPSRPGTGSDSSARVRTLLTPIEALKLGVVMMTTLSPQVRTLLTPIEALKRALAVASCSYACCSNPTYAD